MDGWHLSPIEWFAALTGFACVLLTIKNKISNWPWGIASVLAYGWFFWKTEAYANMWLQIVYFLPCCVYGWWAWAKFGPTHNDDLPVTRLTIRGVIGWCLAVAALTPLFWALLRRTGDPLPFADALTTALSIAGQYLQARKIYENWHFWFVADVIYAVCVFPVFHAYASTALYGLFILMAVWGAKAWQPLIGRPVLKTAEERA